MSATMAISSPRSSSGSTPFSISGTFIGCEPSDRQLSVELASCAESTRHTARHLRSSTQSSSATMLISGMTRICTDVMLLS